MTYTDVSYIQVYIQCVKFYHISEGTHVYGTFISELLRVIMVLGSNGVTCHPTQVNAPRPIPNQIG